MRARHVLAAVLSAGPFLVGVHVEEQVAIEGQTVRAARAPGDGLDELASPALCAGPADALAACAFWDVAESCCPAGCAARKGPNWSKADAILRGCMKGLGCPDSDVNGATVFMKCQCGK